MYVAECCCNLILHGRRYSRSLPCPRKVAQGLTALSIRKRSLPYESVDTINKHTAEQTETHRFLEGFGDAVLCTRTNCSGCR